MLLFSRLIQQSKNPSGFLGKRMMKLWNRAYLPMFVWAIRHLDRTFYPVILDVGVGNGRSTILLKETFPQSTITGIDISDTAIAQAKQREMTNLNFERRDVRETGFSDESVDLITVFQTHFHWRDLEASFMELRRILKSDGMLLLACEYNKLSYFLPEVQSEEAFRRFLLSVGFELVTSQRKESWILYKIRKGFVKKVAFLKSFTGGIGMNTKNRNLIEDNKKAENQSFLYYLHEEKVFDRQSLADLCHYVEKIDSISIDQLRDLHFIENQILRHLVYHFDSNDLSKISNLPDEYRKYIEPFEQAVTKLYDLM